MEQNLSRRQLLGGIGAGTVAGLAGCVGASEEANGDAGEYTIVPYLDPTGDRGWERWSGMTPYWTRVVEPLVWGTDDMQPKPWLATDWEATGETTWVFELREGVTFHNGEEMTADDVVHSFENDILTEYGDFVYGWLHLEPGSVEKIDDYTVKFTNTEPFAGFPGTIGHNMIDIHPPEADPHNGTVIGTGPFVLDEVEDGQQVRVERFDDYWGGDVLPEALTFRAAEDVTTRTNLLEAGDADIILDPAKSRVSSLEDDSSIRVETQQSSGSSFVSINIYNEPTDGGRTGDFRDRLVVDDDPQSQDDLEPRTQRAVNEAMDVSLLSKGGRYEVQSASGRWYEVDVISEWCTCPDWQQRTPEGGCKHMRRVDHEIKRGRVPRPDGRLPSE